jgi:LDH2 family malate/lactate/ureidoglycolate dehydrogenase
VKEESPGRIRLGVAEARQLSEAALRGAGWSPDDSRILADHMLDAALCGYEYSGLAKILNIAEYQLVKPAYAPMRVVHETPMSTRFDGGANNGMLTMFHATELAIEKARATGFGLVGVNNTWMSGRGAYYVERAGLIGIHSVSSRHLVAPPGGARPTMGTNPISFGFPTEADPLVIDLGLSALMYTDLALRLRRGEQLPEGLAIDAQGRPTRDPVAAMNGGATFPFGGHKGFALTLAMQALGVLAGAGEDGDKSAGYLMMAIQPELMMSLDQYRRDLSQSLARLKSTPLQDGIGEIRIPSERAYVERKRNSEEGIVIDRLVHDGLRRLAGF